MTKKSDTAAEDLRHTLKIREGGSVVVGEEKSSRKKVTEKPKTDNASPEGEAHD